MGCMGRASQTIFDGLTISPNPKSPIIEGPISWEISCQLHGRVCRWLGVDRMHPLEKYKQPMLTQFGPKIESDYSYTYMRERVGGGGDPSNGNWIDYYLQQIAVRKTPSMFTYIIELTSLAQVAMGARGNEVKNKLRERENRNPCVCDLEMLPNPGFVIFPIFWFLPCLVTWSATNPHRSSIKLHKPTEAYAGSNTIDVCHASSIKFFCKWLCLSRRREFT